MGAVDAERSPTDPGWYRSLPSWVQRIAPPLTVAGLSISLLVHVVFIALAAIWLVGGGGAGGAGKGPPGGGGVVGVAVMTQQEFSELAGAQAEEAVSTLSETTTSPIASEPLSLESSISSATSSTVTTGGLSEGLSGLSTGAGAGSGDGAGQGGGSGFGSGGGNASFFGVEARGSRFAYICDISGSMDGGVGGDAQTRRIDILRAELDRSVRSLGERSSFAIVLFSSDSRALGERQGWVPASDAGKSWARRAISQIKSEGDTQPSSAFEIVFKLRPRPDAIYFMTDGEFDESHVQRVAALNASLKIPVHSITFVSQQGEEKMRRIADQSGGTYTHVSGTGR